MYCEIEKQIAKEWHEAFGTDELKDKYDKYLHDNFTADFFNGQQVNKQEYIKQDQQFARAFRNNKITVTDQIAEDNKVVSVMTWTAIQIGDIPGIPATGKLFEVKGIAIDHFKDGKIIKHYPLFDQLKMMQQLETIPGTSF
jgi:steroid delta-isomerase-like uncharacterized protein